MGLTSSAKELLKKSREAIKDEILQHLGILEGEEYAWVAADVKRIIADDLPLAKDLAMAGKETARNFINKHGVTHGLVVMQRMLWLFELIYNGDIEPEYTEAGFLSNKGQVLFPLLAASYIHDIGRFYDPEIPSHADHVAQGIEIMRGMTLPPAGTLFQTRVPREMQSHILERTRELCLCHDNKDTPSNLVEIALMKVADALDCTEERAYSEEEVPQLKEIVEKQRKNGIVDEPEKLRVIFSRDKYPEDYLGCSSVSDVLVQYEPDEGGVDVTFHVTNLAGASKPVKTLLRTLQNCKRSPSDTVQELSNRIRVYVVEGDAPDPYLLFPEDPADIQRTPFAKDVSASFIADIENESGIAQFTDIHAIKDVGEKGLQSRIFYCEGLKPIQWEEVTKKEAWVTIRQGGKEKKREATFRYMYPEKQGKGHWWKIAFEDKKGKYKVPSKGECKIKAKYTWPKCFNVKDDEYEITPICPYKSLRLGVSFPQEIKKSKIGAHAEIRDKSQTISKRPIHPHPDRKTRHTTISTIFLQAKPGYRYALTWKLSNT